MFDIIVGASGSRCVIDGFNRWAFKTFVPAFIFSGEIFLLRAYQPLNISRYALDARLAIAITANFVNNW